MADERIRFISEFDDSQLTEAMDRVAAATDSQQGKFDEMAESGDKAFKDIGKAISDNEKSTAKLAKATEDYKGEAKEAEKNTIRFRDAIGQTIRNTNVFGVNLGGIIDRLSKFRSNLVGTIKGLKNTTGAFRILGKVIGAGIFGIVVLAVTALIAAMQKLQPVMDRIRVIGAQISTVVGVLTDKMAKFGGLIISVITGQKSMNEAWQEGKEELSGLNQELIDAAAFAKRYEEAQISLERQTALLTARIALQRGEIRKLRLEAEDETKGFKDRIEAVKEAARLEQELLKEQEKIAKEKIGAELDLFGLTEENNKLIEFQIGLIREGKASFEGLRDTLTALTPTIANDEDVSNFLALIQELGSVQQESLGQQRRLVTEIESLEREQVAAIQRRLKAIKELTDTVDESNAVLGGPAEVAQRQYELALRQIEELKKEARSLGLELDFSGIEQIAKAQFERAKDAAIGALEGIPAGLEDIGEKTGEIIASLFPDRDLQQEGLEAGKAIANAFAEGFEGASDETIAEIITDKLQKAFDINDAQLQFIAGSVGMIFESVIAGIDATTQAAISQQDQIIDAIQGRIQETERLLAIEQQRQEDGFANDVSRLREKLEKEQAERAKAEEQRQELEKRAARQRLIQNSLEQASNFVLAITKMTAAEAGKGIIGIFTALAGVALITRIIAQAKSTQFEVPQFREGTPFLHGPSHEKGGVLIEAEGRERIISAALNQKLGGSSLSNEDLYHYFQIGKLMESVNRSPLPGAVADARKDQRRLEEMKVNLPFEIMQGAYQKAADKAADKMIRYWKSRPIEKPDGSGGKVVEWKEGQRIERHKVKKG